MRRFLSLWFPNWSLDRLRRARRLLPAGARSAEDTPPYALVETDAQGAVIAAADRAAQRCGVKPGQRFADAKACAPELIHEPIDRAADAEALARLGDWMIRWTPLVALDPLDGLMLETTGCERLYDGEAKLAAQLGEVLTGFGLSHRIGVAGTPGAAWALARHQAGAGQPALLPPGAERAGLADLPLAGLRLSEDALRVLRRFGLTRIGQLYGVDRKALTRRFPARAAADAVRLRLDQALGLYAEPLAYLQPEPEDAVRLPCPEPLLSLEGLRAGLERLLNAMAERLERRGLGARALTLYAFRTDGTRASVAVTTARPTRTPAHLIRLFEERLDRIDPGFGVDLVVLHAVRTAPMTEPGQGFTATLSGPVRDVDALAALADRLTAKLGERAVSVRAPVSSHRPDRAERPIPFEGAFPDWSAVPPLPSLRPLRVFDRPEPVEALAEIPDGPPVRFVWRRVARRIVRADGPERIAPEWWRQGSGQARARDYYRVEDDQGRRYWLFREGLYGDGRGHAPGWFVQGLFA